MPGSVTIIDKKAGEQGPEIWLDAYLLAPERALVSIRIYQYISTVIMIFSSILRISS